MTRISGTQEKALFWFALAQLRAFDFDDAVRKTAGVRYDTHGNTVGALVKSGFLTYVQWGYFLTQAGWFYALRRLPQEKRQTLWSHVDARKLARKGYNQLNPLVAASVWSYIARHAWLAIVPTEIRRYLTGYTWTENVKVLQFRIEDDISFRVSPDLVSGRFRVEFQAYAKLYPDQMNVFSLWNGLHDILKAATELCEHLDILVNGTGTGVFIVNDRAYEYRAYTA